MRRLGFVHVKEAGEAGEGRCHWRVLREKGYHLTYVFKTGFGCCMETRVSGTESEAGRRARVVVGIQMRNGPDPRGWAVKVVRGRRAWLCVEAGAGRTS